MNTIRDFSALYEQPPSDMNFQVLEPSEGQIVMPGADFSGFYDWLKTNLNDRLWKTHARTSRVEQLVNSTAESLPGYLRNYLSTVTNPMLVKQFVLNAEHPPMGYLFNEIYDSMGLVYNWTTEFGAGRNICLFPLIEVGGIALDDEILTIVYRNGRPMDPLEYRVYKQISGLSLFIPLDILELNDVLDVEVRRMWNGVKWAKADLPLGSEPGTQLLFDINDLGAFYCIEDYQIYAKTYDGSLHYYKYVTPESNIFTLEKTVDGSHLKMTFLGLLGPDGSLTNTDKIYQLAIVNNSAGWATRVRVPDDSYRTTVALLADNATATNTTRWVDTESFSALTDKMPLPVVSANELTVFVTEPGATPSNNFGHFKLVPNVDFVLRQSASGEEIDPARIRFYGYSATLKAKALVIHQYLSADTNLQTYLGNVFTNDPPNLVKQFNTNVIDVINNTYLQNPPLTPLTMYDFECIANASDSVWHFSADDGNAYMTMDNLLVVAQSPYDRNIEDLGVWFYKHWRDITYTIAAEYAPYRWSTQHPWNSLGTVNVIRYSDLSISSALGLKWLNDWTEEERIIFSNTSNTLTLEQVNGIMGDQYRVLFEDHQQFGDLSKWAIVGDTGWTFKSSIGGSQCIEITGPAGDTSFASPIVEASYGSADFDVSFDYMVTDLGAHISLFLKATDIYRDDSGTLQTHQGIKIIIDNSYIYVFAPNAETLAYRSDLFSAHSSIWHRITINVRKNRLSVYTDDNHYVNWRRFVNGAPTGSIYSNIDLSLDQLKHIGGLVYIARSGASGTNLYIKDFDIRGWGSYYGGPSRPGEIVLGRPAKPGSAITIIKSDPSTWYEDSYSASVINDDGTISLPERSLADGGSFPIAPYFIDATANNKNVSKDSIESITDRNVRIKQSSSPGQYVIGNNGIYLRSVVMRCTPVTEVLSRYWNQGAFRTDLERWLQLIDFSVEDHRTLFSTDNMNVDRDVTIHHLLNRYPQVLILDTEGISITPTQIKYNSTDEVLVRVPNGTDTGTIVLQ